MLFVIKQSRWPLAALAVLVASQAFGHGMSEAEKQSIMEGGNLRYLWIGATHMLSGYLISKNHQLDFPHRMQIGVN